MPSLSAPCGKRGGLHLLIFLDRRAGVEQQAVAAEPVDEARVAAYFGLILVILLPCMPSPAMSPFWPKMNA